MESTGSKLGTGDRGVGTVFKLCQHCIGQDDLRFRELELDGDGDLAEEDGSAVYHHQSRRATRQGRRRAGVVDWKRR
jgi:hypothetical protein